MKYVWIEKDKNIKNIVNEEMKVHIKWSKKPEKDYIKLSKQYMNAGYITLKEIIEGPHNNNIKYDMWFLPSVYMMRQAIELLIKSGIAIKGATKSELQTIFIATKHDVRELYTIYKDSYGVGELNEVEKTWLEKYLDSIELVDSSSDLFRYPFKDDFMQQYGDKVLDVVHMGNRLIYCYSTLNKMICGEWFNEVELNVEESTHFLKWASTGLNNCYLWDSPWSDGFHKQITGYSEVAKFLYENFKESKDKALFYPIVFLMRNAIEIGLKRLLHMQMHQGVDEHIVRSKRNSHLLYKDLWKSIKPMLVHYSKEDNQKEETLELAESYIRSISRLDKHGDMFRYPCSYSNEYKFNGVEIDVDNFYSYMLGLFHFIEGCDAWLDNIKDYEMEMRREWESEMRSYME
ncbi:hypothetical protein HXA34_19650 [Salipaludibacillus agaradhaerens]|uniref:hypothetical protein n=1 Tax=Salipaludibacillus agaradhaerens TaxID=76935 RepID=UPI0021515318|nr:hypothetical protein [Salipaludibacillus agaradhaerens]MCR6108520.1 hypothetical protein [Salipaludibacillus agaradhaerens]MCR6120541.1 hypothetical protein [Salipaludibacillus agaradhaerens]UJW59549.1 hypothetical protein HXZ66_20115 [Bacillus sp. A116_S68]